MHEIYHVTQMYTLFMLLISNVFHSMEMTHVLLGRGDELENFDLIFFPHFWNMEEVTNNKFK